MGNPKQERGGSIPSCYGKKRAGGRRRANPSQTGPKPASRTGSEPVPDPGPDPRKLGTIISENPLMKTIIYFKNFCFGQILRAFVQKFLK